MKQVIGMICFIVTVLAVLGNGIFMVVSPRLWFRIPHWARLSGRLSESKFGSGWGAIQIRVLGLSFLAIMIWFLHGCASTR